MAFVSVEVVLDSIDKHGNRLTTMALKYPRFIHAEFMTHRVFSRSASSSRAIPVNRMLKNILGNPARPDTWGKNVPGMQAGEELTPVCKAIASSAWFVACFSACAASWVMHKIGLHKQHANRVTEPFQYITTLVTATEWDNFFALRAHPDAQPEIQKLAVEMRKALDKSVPTALGQGQWHLPYLQDHERTAHPLRELLRISSARCARVSYLNHDGSTPNAKNDLALFERLAGSEPIHASPLEHVATPTYNGNTNFVGWKQFRKVIEG